MDSPLWIFGYGSLMWRPGFAHAVRHRARLDGWVRRFWQGSPDHRGTPDAPGRVVTLMPDRTGHVDGLVYQVAPAVATSVIAALDVREIAGYERHEVTVTLVDGREQLPGVLVYVAPSTNPNHLGPAPVAAIAEQVLRSHGPSGPNTEYVLLLADALRSLDFTDDEVFALEAAIRAGSGGAG